MIEKAFDEWQQIGLVEHGVLPSVLGSYAHVSNGQNKKPGERSAIDSNQPFRAEQRYRRR
jgi:hypothetical protein